MKCRSSILLKTSHFKKRELVRGEAIIRCDLDKDHSGSHWLRLMQPWKPGRKPKQVGYLFWDGEVEP